VSEKTSLDWSGVAISRGGYTITAVEELCKAWYQVKKVVQPENVRE
jgi:hypothetical protein